MTRILIVEDAPDLREMMVMFLEMEGFEVTEAENGTEALKVYKPGLVDIILSDVNMPAMDGIEFFRQLKASNDTTPFVFLTGHASECTKEMSPLVDGFGVTVLEKPILPKELCKRLRLELEKHTAKIAIPLRA